MTTELPPYPEYKASGVPWLGDVPAHWQQLPGRACYQEKKIPNAGLRETTVLSLSYGQIVVKPPEKLFGLVPASFETYQIVEPGDIIARPTDLQNDWNSLRFGLNHHSGIITSAYMCLRTQPAVLREYGHLLLHAYDLKKVFYGLGSGLRQNLDWRDFKYLPCLVPPRDEQQAIVRYLDHIDRRVRRYIRAKQRLLALLHEQKQAIIHQTVTRGLDASAPLKPSGVAWLGDVPAHWEVRKLGHVARVFNGTTPSRAETKYWNNGTIPWLSSGKVNEYVVDSPSELVTDLALKECSLSLVPKGSVIVGLIGQGKTRGTTARLKINACINQNLAAIVPQFGFDSNYIHHLFTAFYKPIREGGRGGNQEALNCQIVSSLRLPFPNHDEQTRISTFLDQKLAGIVSLERTHQQQIDLIREYRTRLIADVVTGKVDVRAAAAALPVEAVEDTVWAEGEGEHEGEEVGEEELQRMQTGNG